ncbi:hypothetical protein [Microbacterium sp.]|uniref:hypothetical protein n=1 Tax=Microbacterium sp. TaxID=51671 RepID=UPI003F94C56B
MNSINNNEETSRPFGFWLKATDRLMAAEFAAAFESFGVTRREWRLLNRIDGTVSGDARPVSAHKLGRLIDLGWVTDADGTWTLTDEGRAAKESLGGIVDGIRAKITDAVPAEDLATTVATLEQLARAFGWDENTPLPRGGGRRHGGHGHGGRRHGHGHRGFGYGHGFGYEHGFGHKHGFGHEQGFGHGGRGFGHEGHGSPEMGAHESCRHGEHDFAHGREGHRGHGGPHGHRGGHGHARARFARFAQGAYERGFEAGFTRGHDDR